jgi:hypothetical protein
MQSFAVDSPWKQPFVLSGSTAIYSSMPSSPSVLSVPQRMGPGISLPALSGSHTGAATNGITIEQRPS